MTENQKAHRIVAEITHNWTSKKSDLDKPLLSQQFEAVIQKNAERGYDLDGWQFHQVMTTPNALCKTIIAVFVKHDEQTSPKTPSN